ncbi:MAG: GNAT family N-acetyltransferase [Agathobacter sp.]
MEYRLPTVKDKREISEYLEEHFQNGEKDIIFCQDTLIKDYSKWVSQIQNNADIGHGDWGKSLLLLCYDEHSIVGILVIRYEPSPELEKLYGNIGYGVRPSERNKGYATQMLRYALEVCKEKGLRRAFLGCHSDNIASASVIKKCGGILTMAIKESEEITNHYYEINL